MEQLDLLGTDPEAKPEPSAKRGKGPPNRMNDLPYREWMKFQKSFFRHVSDNALVTECVEFFTKAQWTDGTISRSLILGFDDTGPLSVAGSRVLESRSRFSNHAELADDLEHRLADLQHYDFVLIDLRRYVTGSSTLTSFVSESSDRLFGALRRILPEHRYCGVIASANAPGGSGFPIPWAIAQSARRHLRLRDEKVGIIEGKDELYYCLFFQAQDDRRSGDALLPANLQTVQLDDPVPGWIIPKSPPRSKNEILHPAKYPESLIERFIDRFTPPGGTVFDPMVGTGSTVIAAMRKKRHGVGVELSQRFAGIALQRILNEQGKSLDLFGSQPMHGSVITGDAVEMEQMPELRGKRFDYAVTSPPYWSMLANPGSENQAARRAHDLPLVYSQNESDLGNIKNYDEFLSLLQSVYEKVADKLVAGGLLTVIVKNVKREHIVYPLAWDLTALLCGRGGRYQYVGTTMWCQDDVVLKPFAVGIHWVSNVLHQYCLHFRTRPS